MGLNQLLVKLHQKVVGQRRNGEDHALVKFFREHIKSNAVILDVGCGLGHNLTLLKDSGYPNIIGTDISSEMINFSKSKGHLVYSPEDLSGQEKRFDVLLFSHVLEHINYSDIQKVLESYFQLCNPGALVVICMPLVYDGFYHDVDHIKPYYAKGLITLFSEMSVPKQYSSKYRLNLIDINYFRDSLLPYHLRCRHIRGVINYLVLAVLTGFFWILKIVTLGLASKVISYVAVFKLTTPHTDHAKEK